MRKYPIAKIALVILLVFAVAYAVYDNYFQLPFGRSAKNAEDSEETISRFNILIVGLDGRANLNDRTDTIILAAFDGEKNEAQMLSIPRDTRVKIKGKQDKINAAYAYGGIDLTKKTVSEFLDVEIDRYVIVDFVSLVKLVDEVGGIEVDVPVRMYVPLEGIDIKPGLQHLNGEQVLAYSRFRGTIEGDIGRVKRQQQVITLLAEKLTSLKNIAQLTQLIPIYKEEVETDLSIKEMIALARMTPDILDKGINTQVLPGANKKIDGLWFWEPDLSELNGILTIPISVADE